MNPTDEQPSNQSPNLAPSTAPVPPTPLTSEQPAPSPMTPQGRNPGKTLGIVSLVLAFVGFSLVGLILAIVAKMKSSKAGFKNTLAIVSMVINSIFLILTPIILVMFIIAYGALQGHSRDRLTFAELNGLHKGVASYIQEKRTIPASLSEVVANGDGLNESYLTDSEGRAYTLSWDPAGCRTLTTCTSYTLSGKSSRPSLPGENVSIKYDALTGKTTYVNKPSSSTDK